MFLFCKWFPYVKFKSQDRKNLRDDTDCIIKEILNQTGEE